MEHNKVSINNNQFKALIICATWPSIINYGSSILARVVGRDIWISGLISIVSTMVLSFIIVFIGKNSPGKTIVEYSQELLGTILGKLIGLVLAVYFFILATNSVSMYIHHLTDFLLPETPFIVVTVVHVAIVCYLVWKGPEVIARLGVLGFVAAIIFYLLVFLASLPEINFNRILPFFDSGIADVSKASLKADTYVGIIPLMMAMIIPLINNQKKIFRSAVVGLSIGGGFFVFYFIVELMVMGPQVVALMRIASMDFVRSIQITQYLHRFESFMVGLWYWSILVQTGILAYCALKAFMQTTGIKKRKPWIIYIFGILLALFTYLIAYDRVLFLNFRESQWGYIALPIQYGIPVILLIILIIKKALKIKG